MGATEYTVVGAAFSKADVGRYLRVTGSGNGGNSGAFPIVAVTSATTAVVVNAKATAEVFAATYTVVAGAGPVPGNSNDPIAGGDELTVAILPGGDMAFHVPESAPIPAGDAFVLDTASQAVIGKLPLDGTAVTLGCAGQGGSCGLAQATLVRISSTDGSVAGLSPAAMPAPIDKPLARYLRMARANGSPPLTATALTVKRVIEVGLLDGVRQDAIQRAARLSRASVDDPEGRIEINACSICGRTWGRHSTTLRCQSASPRRPQSRIWECSASR